jgi:hypothetical protein
MDLLVVELLVRALLTPAIMLVSAAVVYLLLSFLGLIPKDTLRSDRTDRLP